MALQLSLRRHAAFRHHLRQFSVIFPSLPERQRVVDPTIRRLLREKNFSQIESILESQKSQNPTNPDTLCSVIASYAYSGMLDPAIKTLTQIPNPSTTHFNAFLCACNFNHSLFKQVPNLFQDLIKKHYFIPDKISYGILVKSYCKSKDAEKCFAILKEMKEKNVEATTVTYTTILDLLYKEEKIEEADMLWEEMMKKNIELDVAAYNVRIMNRAVSGKIDEVMEVMEEMKSKGLEPDVFTYNYMIQCYCNMKNFDEAKKVYIGMEVRNHMTYKNLVAELVKNGDLEGGLEVFNDAVKEKKVPDLHTIKLLVRNLIGGEKIRAAKRVVTGLKKKFPDDFIAGWSQLEKMVAVDNVEVEAV